MARIAQRNLMWGAAALLGIAATAAIGWAASQLAHQPIGLSSDPISVANGLAPALPRDSHQDALAHFQSSAGLRDRPWRVRHHARMQPPSTPAMQAGPTSATVVASAPTPAPPASSASSAAAASPAASSAGSSSSAGTSSPSGSTSSSSSSSGSPVATPARSAGSVSSSSTSSSRPSDSSSHRSDSGSGGGDGGGGRDD